MNTPSGLQRLHRCVKSSLLARTLLLIGSMSAMVAATFIVFALATGEQKAQERATRQLHELIEAAGASAGQACFANDKTLGQEIVQAIIKSSDVSRVEIRCGDARLALAERQAAGVTAASLPPVVRALFCPLYVYDQIGEMAVTPNGQAIDSIVARDVGDLSLMLVLFGAGILIAMGLAADAIILRPLKAISKQLRSCDMGAEVCVAVPPHHAENVLGRLASEVNDLLQRLRGSMQHEWERHRQKALDDERHLAGSMVALGRTGIDAADPDELGRSHTETPPRIGATAATVGANVPAVLLVAPSEADDMPELSSELAIRGYQVDTCTLDADLPSRLDSGNWQFLVLDLDAAERLPEDISAEYPARVLLVPTGRPQDAIRALKEFNAIAFIEKPANPDILATIMARARPEMPDQSGQCASRSNDAVTWRLDMTSWRFTGCGDGVAQLTHAETAFLATLAKSPGQAVPRGELITAMGHRSEYYDRRRLDTFVSRLRKKVVTGCGAELPLRSIHGYGYALAAPIHLA